MHVHVHVHVHEHEHVRVRVRVHVHVNMLSLRGGDVVEPWIGTSMKTTVSLSSAACGGGFGDFGFGVRAAGALGGGRSAKGSSITGGQSHQRSTAAA